MSSKGLYQPQIADVHIQKLYHIAKRQGVPMTKLLNLIVAVAIEELEGNGTGALCDASTVGVIVAESQRSGIHGGVIPTPAHPAQSRPKKHERGRLYHAHALRQRHKRQEV